MSPFKTSVILLLAGCLALDSFAKNDDPALAVSAIPAALKTNAHAIIRYASTELSIEATDRMQRREKYAITILDEQGKDLAGLFRSYNLHLKINDIKGTLLDAAGKEIRSLKEKDIFDRSTYGMDAAFHSDARFKTYDFNHIVYPYTVVFEIEETFKTTFFLPTWQPQPARMCAVEKANLHLSFAPGLQVRYKELFIPQGARTEGKDAKGFSTIDWQLQNVNAYKAQPLSVVDNYERATVLLAPGTFQLMQYTGNMESWQQLGAFIYQLNEGRDQLPGDKKALVQSIIGNETDTYKKVQKLYAYMQQNTRYVLNAYGISGWQTFDAENVAHNGYGDCKGLTNYLKAMLKEAGIKSYAALVSAGENYYKLDEKFPANTFNHVILCIPQAKDSIWVECTSRELPAGYLGSFTQNRKVLLTTEDGGFLCNTPAYNKDKSFIVRKASLQLDPAAGQQQVQLQNTYSGLLQDDLYHILKSRPKEQVKEWLNTRALFPSYSVTGFDYKYGTNTTLPTIEETIQATISGVTSGTQKRTFLNINWLKNPVSEAFQTEPRTLPLVLDQSFRVTDSVIVTLPEGMTIEALPQPKDIEYPFASYHTKFSKNAGAVILVRSYEQNNGVYKPEAFEDYQKLYQDINRDKDNMNIVLLNKTP